MTNEHKLALYGIILTNSDGAYTKITEDIDKGEFYLSGYDAYADIKIYGGTYAHIDILNSEQIMEKISMDLITNDSTTYLTFTDITLSNPIFKSHGCISIIIKTDGLYWTAYGIFFDSIPRRNLIYKIHQEFSSAIWLDSKKKVLFYNMMSHGVFDYADLVEVNKNLLTYDIGKEVKKWWE